MSVKIISMNTSGGSDCPRSLERGTKQSRQRKAIHDIVVRNKPDIVVFQEFIWRNIRGSTWGDNALPEDYIQFPHDDTRIVVNKNRVQNEKVIPETVLQNLDPNPIDKKIAKRHYTVRILKVDNNRDIICMSWHGPHKVKSKREYFEKLMEFVANIQNEYNFPMIVAGDFNVDIYDVSDLIIPPFKIIDCDRPRERRIYKNIIDFIVATDTLVPYSRASWLDLNQTGAIEPERVLDHDPITASFDIYDKKELEDFPIIDSRFHFCKAG